MFNVTFKNKGSISCKRNHNFRKCQALCEQDMNIECCALRVLIRLRVEESADERARRGVLGADMLAQLVPREALVFLAPATSDIL